MQSRYRTTLGGQVWRYDTLAQVMARATPDRAGDRLAGVAATSAQDRAAAQAVLADVPLQRFLDEALIPYEDDDVTRLIIDTHDAVAFAPVAHLTVGDFRDWLLSDLATPAVLAALRPGLTPEMAAAVCKIMRNQDLILVAQKCRVTTAFRGTIGLPGRLSTRVQPNHPVDDVNGIDVNSGRIDVCGRRCGDRDQPGDGQCRAGGPVAASDGRYH